MQQQLFKVRDRRNKGWFYIDNDYLNGFGKYLGPIGISVYISLCRHADGEQKCFPSQEKISEEINVSTKTIKKYIRLLKEHNIINIEQKRNNNGKFLHNLYILMDKEVWNYPKGSKLPTEPRGNSFHSRGEAVSKTVGNEVPLKETHINNTHNKNTNPAKQSFAGKTTNEIIDLFREVNPSYKKIFSNKTQRAAIERMLKEHGREKIEQIINTLPKTNKMKYAPTICTPQQLEDKLGQLVAFIQKEKSNNLVIKL